MKREDLIDISTHRERDVSNISSTGVDVSNLDLGDVDFSGANMDNFFADSAKKSNVKFVGAELLLAPNCPW